MINNLSALKVLSVCLAKCGIGFDATQSLIQCFAHIINLCCQDVIHSITDKTLLVAVNSVESNKELITNTRSFPLPIPSHPATQTFEQACAHDPIALGHHIVSGIYTSDAFCLEMVTPLGFSHGQKTARCSYSSFPARRSYPIPSLQGRNTPAAPHFNNC